ncbi:3'(2'),5'-bisphosphate nucleotidase CysQ [Gilvimarinus agarilyticus]|uniref:3'(2'),5'-bisphosphate nucleotidase CysQ n=1 Tax=Gilvimarinus agarilyticus TaxID=679259 RepID=UPI000695B195|nr:3'(2'),5'-bisphosphate nucleotidase CysQ [Gilvimarinus agarilyticus]
MSATSTLSPAAYQQVVSIAQQAGDAILSIYQRDFEVHNKSDDSPLTEADLAAHRLIVAELTTLTPDVPVLSEESATTDWAERQTWGEYWLVDPLDGTKEFIKKNGEFTVNIAHVVNGEPVWGVVVAPALGVTYQGGVASNGSQKNTAAGSGKIQVGSLPSGKDNWCVVGSRSHQSDEFIEFLTAFNNPTITSMGSSLKICLVAEGAAHLYPRLGLTSEWDTAAAHAVLAGAGGKIVHADSGKPLVYNQKSSLLNPFFIAAPANYQGAV